MIVLGNAAQFPGTVSVAALGMFDGVHVGHQSLIRRAVALAKEMDASSVVCTFDRHPLSLICPERAPKPLRTLQENLKQFERLGADYALVEPFSREFSELSPEDYLRALVKNLRAKALVVGENHTFGRAGRGDAALIRRMADELGYRAVVVPSVMDGERMVSSTYIRELLRDGETEHARRLLEIAPDGEKRPV